MEVYHCSGLVSGALCTVIAIRVHTITVKFDGMSQTYPVVKVKTRFVVMKNIPTTMDADDYDISLQVLLHLKTLMLLVLVHIMKEMVSNALATHSLYCVTERRYDSH